MEFTFTENDINLSSKLNECIHNLASQVFKSANHLQAGNLLQVKFKETNSVSVQSLLCLDDFIWLSNMLSSAIFYAPQSFVNFLPRGFNEIDFKRHFKSASMFLSQ